MTKPDLVCLADDDIQVKIDPQAGGRVASIQAFGYDLLRKRRDDPVAWGCYPMVPFAGRIKQGLIRFEGQDYQLPASLGPHAIHGYGFVQPWQVEQSSPSACQLRWTFRKPWPWKGHATQRFGFSEGNFVVTMTATALEKQPMSLGWHPWFVRSINDRGPYDSATTTSQNNDLELIFSANEMYEKGSDEIPSGRLIPPSEPPWDDCFRSLNANPQLHWGPLSLEMSSTVEYWVVYDGPVDALCVEPQSGPPNGVNSSPHILEIGEQLEIQLTFRLTRS